MCVCACMRKGPAPALAAQHIGRSVTRHVRLGVRFVRRDMLRACSTRTVRAYRPYGRVGGGVWCAPSMQCAVSELVPCRRSLGRPFVGRHGRHGSAIFINSTKKKTEYCYRKYTRFKNQAKGCVAFFFSRFLERFGRMKLFSSYSTFSKLATIKQRQQ